jgi:mono/diheme cytochrome c family protein
MKITYLISVFLSACLGLAWGADAAPALEVGSPADLGAGNFASRCAGCHSLTGQKLKGPSLENVKQWNVGDLHVAIKKMEKYAGPLSEEEIERVSQYLHSPDALERLKKEEERLAAQFAVKMEPASASKGKSLYVGSLALKNGGLSCNACHSAEGEGGTLAPDLTQLAAKISGVPLVSAIEKASFPIMEPHYRNHPILKQEALHIAEYLKSIKEVKEVKKPESPLIYSVVVAGAIFLCVVAFYRRTDCRKKSQLQRRRH